VKQLGKIVAVFSLWGALAWAQQSAPNNISVTYVYPKLTISVSQTSDLAAVLGKLCKETLSDCDGAEQATSSKVAPVTLHGNWNEVVSQLMDGSGLNYVTTSPSLKSRGHLIVQGKSLTLPDPAPSAQNMSAEISSEPSVSPTANNSAPSRGNMDESAQNSPQQMGYSTGGDVSHGDGAAGTIMGNYRGTAASLRGSPLTSDMPAQSGSPQQPSFLPFPDSHGNPIPTSNQPVLYLPFPDSLGNPIPADPNKPTGSPFPVEAIREMNNRNPH